MTKIDEVFSLVRTNLTTEQIKQLLSLLKEEVETSERVNLTSIKRSEIEEVDEDLLLDEQKDEELIRKGLM